MSDTGCARGSTRETSIKTRGGKSVMGPCTKVGARFQPGAAVRPAGRLAGRPGQAGLPWGGLPGHDGLGF